MRDTTVWCGFALAAAAFCAPAQPGASKTEATQLYTAAGFSIVDDQPLNRCRKPAHARASFVDINGDGQPEALFVDTDATCYAPSGRYFAVLAREGGLWRSIIKGTGSIQALSTRTAGWKDMRVADGSCMRTHRYDGRSYAAATDCSGRALAAAPPAAAPVPAQPPSAPSGKASTAKLPPADEAAAFKAAGFAKRGGVWRACGDPGTAGYEPGRIDSVADRNGDGLPEAVIAESSSFCFGNTGYGYWLVTRLAHGGWKLVSEGTGIPEFLQTKGADGWPDISIGGPGFCFPVLRWNGREYKQQRWEYQGKPCKPSR